MSEPSPPPFGADRILDAAGVAVISIDAHGVVATCNPAAGVLFATGCDEVIGMRAPFTFCWPADVTRFVRSLEATLATGAGQTAVLRVTGTDGEPVVVTAEFRALEDDLLGARAAVVSMNPVPSGASALGAQAALGDFTSLTEDSRDAVVRWDDAMRMTYMNRAAEMNAGVPREEVLGMTHHEMPAYNPRYSGSIREVLATGEPREDEFEFQSAKGDSIYVRTRYLPELASDGRVRSVLTVSQDVTRRKQVELELARLVLVNTRSAQREAAFRRIAERIAGGESLEEVCEATSREAVALLGATQAWVTRSAENGDGLFVGGSGAPIARHVAPDDARRRDTPVMVEGREWGVFSTIMPGEPSAEARAALGTLADLIATASVNARIVGELERMARTDSMTGLPNRRAFFEQLEREFDRARRHGDGLAIAIIDLDHFKQINDRHGHGVGDDALCAIARRLAATVRRGEVMARIGGEEFAWILPRVDLETAVGVLERARRSIAGHSVDVVGPITVSAGVAGLRDDDSLKSLMARADGALYRAKHGGRDRVEAEEAA